jgi:N-acetylglucosaminyl-diphospho-decaprenol L-rhamnosyltransferase
MSSPLLSSTAVVTVTYNSSSQLAEFLDSVQHSEEADLVVVVADNCSNDIESTTQISARFGAELLLLSDNRGYGGAINAAVAQLPEKFKYILISNPDVTLGKLTISTMLEEIEKDAHIAAVGPRVLNSDGTVYPSARQLPSLRNGIGHALFARIWPRNPWSRSYRAESADSETLRRVGWLSGSCLLVRRSAFDQLGGFDEGFFMYFEDVDLGYRLGKAGWANVFAPRASVVHTGAHSTSSESDKMIRAHHNSAYRYLEKKYSAPYLAPVRWALKVGLADRARLAARNGRSS